MRISDWSSDVCSSDLSGTHECSQPALSGHSQVWCSGSRMGPRSRLSTRDRPTGCEEETICAGRSAATHRRRRCSGLSELLAVSLDSEEHTSELQSLMRISYAVFCLKKKKT